MDVWRITRAPFADLSGIGGELAGGRWHSKGRRIVYCADTPSLALLEVLVGLDVPWDLLPDDYVLMQMQVPDSLGARSISAKDLAAQWNDPFAGEDTCRAIGDDWLKNGESALLIVPSAIVPIQYNVLVNPSHRDARPVRITRTEPFRFDPRLKR